ncbi:MAG: lytic transglycosylase domain-containing protein [Treponema sp.]|nr:lytic transglycosylase domain-containing protein [Treponema sp.]
MKNSRIFLFSILSFFFCPFSLPCQTDIDRLFEKVELEELPPADEYYIDDSPLHQIFKLMDEEDYARQKKFLEEKQKKVIKASGGLFLPQDEYCQDKVHDFIARYMTNFGKNNLCNILDRGEIYRLYIRNELKKRNMPAILEYLPLVESEYKPLAKSRSGARGLWQFMENSMHPFLTKDSWLDERLDPWKSTGAALSKLMDNYRIFSDWPLAIAAYNCGAGAMSRALKKSKVKSFWYLAEHKMIPEETINYLPKLFAISEIAENGSEYKIDVPQVQENTRNLEFDYITISFSLSLERLAGELRMDYEVLKKLNSELLKDVTPPYNYTLRLPSGFYLSAAQAIYSLSKED